ncbi:MAG: hypothetical protein RJA11_1702, partial [Bacteroidota bacterium]
MIVILYFLFLISNGCVTDPGDPSKINSG